MAPKAKAATPAITTHHSLPAGGAPSEASEAPSVGEGSEAILTRPKKLVLKPLHETLEADDVSTDDQADQVPEVEESDAPLVLESAADAASSMSKKGGAKPAELPTDKIELPLEDVADEPATDEAEEADPTPAPDVSASEEKPETPEVIDPNEGAAAKEVIDANEARAQKTAALAASGKYQVHIHESARSKAGATTVYVIIAAVLVAAAYYAGAEGLLGSGLDLPKFW